MGDMEFNGTPEEWDTLVKKNKEQETLEEAADRLQKDKYGIFISKKADVKGQLVIDTVKAAFLAGMIEGAKWMEEQMEKLKDFDTWKEWKNNAE